MARENRALWTSDRRLYLNANGQVVEADDPTRVSLLVRAGGTMLRSEAERLGLLAEAEATAETSDPKARAIPANKARTASASKATEE